MSFASRKTPLDVIVDNVSDLERVDTVDEPARKKIRVTSHIADTESAAESVGVSYHRHGAAVLQDANFALREQLIEAQERIEELRSQLADAEEGEREANGKVLETVQDVEATIEAERNYNTELLQLAQNEMEGARELHLKDLDRMEETMSCEVCWDKLWAPYILPGCGHCFCEICLANWFKSTMPRVTCPICREPVKSQPVELFLIKKLLNGIQESRARLEAPIPEIPERSDEAKAVILTCFPSTSPPDMIPASVVAQLQATLIKTEQICEMNRIKVFQQACRHEAQLATHQKEIRTAVRNSYNKKMTALEDQMTQERRALRIKIESLEHTNAQYFQHFSHKTRALEMENSKLVTQLQMLGAPEQMETVLSEEYQSMQETLKTVEDEKAHLQQRVLYERQRLHQARADINELQRRVLTLQHPDVARR